MEVRSNTDTHLTPSTSSLSQEKYLKVNQEASFAVQRNGARGVVDAKVLTPSGSAEECYVTELDSGMPPHTHRHTSSYHLLQRS